MYLSNHELASSSQNAAGQQRSALRRLPYDHCALSLIPYETPCCGPDEGVVFDLLALMPYLSKYKKNPVTGRPMTSRDVLRLNMFKNAQGEWHCPVTFKVFNDSSHIVAIRTSGNVYSYEAVQELNIKAKNWEDLTTGEAFMKSDIITLLNNQDDAHAKQRDISNFAHLQQVRQGRETDAAVAAAGPRLDPTAERVLRELADKRQEEQKSGVAKRALEEIFGSTVATAAGYGQGSSDDDGEDVALVMALSPSLDEINPGMKVTDTSKSAGFTSTSFGSIATTSVARPATAAEVREARFRHMRELKQKALVQLQTNFGQLNLELHADIAPRACWNFLALCEKQYYNGKKFHRLVPGFTLQGGSEGGSGKGGKSAFPLGRAFKDEFDPRLSHSGRGVLSMANSGPDNNKSQFFITLGDCRYLDNKHTVFGRLVGGAACLDRIEAVGASDFEVPLEDVLLIRTEVFSSPVEAADSLIVKDIEARRASSSSSAAVPTAAAAAATITGTGTGAGAGVGKYVLALNSASHLSSNSNSSSSSSSSSGTGQAGAGAGAGAEEEGPAVKKVKSAGFGSFSSW